MKKALRFRKAFFGAKFANKAEPANLNRATGVVLVMLGVAILDDDSIPEHYLGIHEYPAYRYTLLYLRKET